MSDESANFEEEEEIPLEEDQKEHGEEVNLRQLVTKLSYRVKCNTILTDKSFFCCFENLVQIYLVLHIMFLYIRFVDWSAP